jgi:cytosine/adenosine deaminase-related metal-dependent hydrolase
VSAHSASKLALVNGRNRAGRRIDLRISGGRILDIGVAPDAQDHVLDLQGDRLLPGLINGHDHLQLNHFPALTYRNDYDNVGEWIVDIESRRQIDSALQAAAAVDSREKLFIGGLKNLLAGVTSVAHHDPWYDALRSSDFPVRALHRYGWSHSLFLDGDDQVRRAHSQTPLDAPWIVHAAEGVDATAAAEFTRLRALGCIAPNTVIVHGVAMTRKEQLSLAQAGGGMIWCPASNLRLFGRTATVDALLPLGQVALGTDSRLSGSRDLLVELQVAHAIAKLDEPALESLVTSNAARVLRMPECGALLPGYVADVTILPRDALLSNVTRGDVRLVMSRGSALYGDVTYMQSLAPQAWAAVRVDGVAKALRSTLADRVFSMTAREPGLEPAGSEWKVA